MGSDFNEIAKPFIDQLCSLGWSYLSAEESNALSSGRVTLAEHLQVPILRQKLIELNRREVNGKTKEWLDEARIQQAIAGVLPEIEVSQRDAETLLQSNRRVAHHILWGYKVEGLPDWDLGKDQVIQYFDWFHPENNEFIVCGPYTLKTDAAIGLHRDQTLAVDFALLVNGIPIAWVAVGEGSGQAGMEIALEKFPLQVFEPGSKEHLPSLTFNFLSSTQLLIALSLDDAKLAAVGSRADDFAVWKTLTAQQEADIVNRLHLKSLSHTKQLVAGCLGKRNLLDLIRHYLLNDVDAKHPHRYVCAYPQYRAVAHAVARLRSGKTRVQDGVVDRRGGVIWHTPNLNSASTTVALFNKMRNDAALRRFKVIYFVDDNFSGRQLQIHAQSWNEFAEFAQNEAELNALLNRKGAGVILINSTKDSWLVADNKPVKRWQDEETNQQNPAATILVLAEQASTFINNKIFTRVQNLLPNCVKIGFADPDRESQNGQSLRSIFGEDIDRYTLVEWRADQSNTTEISRTPPHVIESGKFFKSIAPANGSTFSEKEHVSNDAAIKNAVSNPAHIIEEMLEQDSRPNQVGKRKALEREEKAIVDASLNPPVSSDLQGVVPIEEKHVEPDPEFRGATPTTPVRRKVVRQPAPKKSAQASEVKAVVDLPVSIEKRDSQIAPEASTQAEATRGHDDIKITSVSRVDPVKKSPAKSASKGVHPTAVNQARKHADAEQKNSDAEEIEKEKNKVSLETNSSGTAIRIESVRIESVVRQPSPVRKVKSEVAQNEQKKGDDKSDETSKQADHIEKETITLDDKEDEDSPFAKFGSPPQLSPARVAPHKSNQMPLTRAEIVAASEQELNLASRSDHPQQMPVTVPVPAAALATEKQSASATKGSSSVFDSLFSKNDTREDVLEKSNSESANGVFAKFFGASAPKGMEHGGSSVARNDKLESRQEPWFPPSLKAQEPTTKSAEVSPSLATEKMPSIDPVAQSTQSKPEHVIHVDVHDSMLPHEEPVASHFVHAAPSQNNGEPTVSIDAVKTLHNHIPMPQNGQATETVNPEPERKLGSLFARVSQRMEKVAMTAVTFITDKLDSKEPEANEPSRVVGASGAATHQATQQVKTMTGPEVSRAELKEDFHGAEKTRTALPPQLHDASARSAPTSGLIGTPSEVLNAPQGEITLPQTKNVPTPNSIEKNRPVSSEAPVLIARELARILTIVQVTSNVELDRLANEISVIASPAFDVNFWHNEKRATHEALGVKVFRVLRGSQIVEPKRVNEVKERLMSFFENTWG